LNERITVRYDLKPLAREDVRHYIEHRLATAGADKGSNCFTTGSYDLIYRLSRGIPRWINAICDRALLIAYGRDLRTIDRRLVRAAFRDIGPGYLTETGVRRRTVLILIALLAAFLLMVAGYVVFQIA
jgi:general secretion pathway protein A